MHVLLAGGTGTAGRVLAAHAASAGHRVRVLSRRAPSAPDPDGVERVVGDLVTGTGLAQAMAGVDVVVDLSNTTTARRGPATAFFTTGTRRLLEAEAAADVGHHLVVSIVGVDRFPSAYYPAKRQQDLTALAEAERHGVGCTVARTTQFHDFAVTVAERFRLGRVVLAPPLLMRPVHLDDVAAHLLGLVAAGPAGYADELGGPREEVLPDLVRRYAAAVRQPLHVHPLPLVGALGRANRAGVLRPAAGARGTRSFDDWLEEVSCSPRLSRA
jgi:uncharacterized protein YbjT (DUF2867 family)